MSASETTAENRVCDLSPADFKERLSGPGLGVRIGEFDLHVRTDEPSLFGPLYLLYSHFPLIDGERIYSIHAELKSLSRRPWRRKKLVRFIVDGRKAHDDQPVAHALPALEWGINLVIAMRFHCFLMLHSAAVERNGHVLLLPALPGHGKTTLAAALAHRGWRLFSDEFGLLRPGSLEFLPLPRPMPLKNESIGVIREEIPEAVLGPKVENTRKGTVAHVRPPQSSVDRQNESAPARWIVFPRWQKDAALQSNTLAKNQAFMILATNSFNYDLLGEAGFCSVRDLIDGCDCRSLIYSSLDDAVSFLTDMADSDAAR